MRPGTRQFFRFQHKKSPLFFKTRQSNYRRQPVARGPILSVWSGWRCCRPCLVIISFVYYCTNNVQHDLHVPPSFLPFYRLPSRFHFATPSLLARRPFRLYSCPVLNGTRKKVCVDLYPRLVVGDTCFESRKCWNPPKNLEIRNFPKHIFSVQNCCVLCVHCVGLVGAQFLVCRVRSCVLVVWLLANKHSLSRGHMSAIKKRNDKV